MEKHPMIWYVDIFHRKLNQKKSVRGFVQIQSQQLLLHHQTRSHYPQNCIDMFDLFGIVVDLVDIFIEVFELCHRCI